MHFNQNLGTTIKKPTLNKLTPINNDPKTIIPIHSNNYVKNLPSSFNALMNHLNEEESRSKMRKNAAEGLSKIIKAENPLDINTDNIINDNIETLKNLLGSHFHEEHSDDQYRKLATQAKKSINHQKMRNFSESYFKKNNEVKLNNDEETKNYLKQRANELSVLINKAKIEGREEAKEIISKYKSEKKLDKLIGIYKQNDSIPNSKTARENYYRNMKEKKLLSSKLVIRKTLINQKIPFTINKNTPQSEKIQNSQYQRNYTSYRNKEGRIIDRDHSNHTERTMTNNHFSINSFK